MVTLWEKSTESFRMKIIGITSHQSGVHDNSVALVENNKILFAEAEERVSRVKHDGRFPWLAINEALKFTKTKLSDIDYFVSGNPESKLFRNLFSSLKFIPVVGLKNYLTHGVKRFVYKIDKIYEGNRPKTFQEANFPSEKLIKISHYLAHAASVYYSGPFDKCLVVTMDGYGPGARGEPLSGQIFLGDSGELIFLENVPVWGTMGLYYGAVTKALGFKLNDGEGKTMGLAAYGKPEKCYLKMKSFFPNFRKGEWTIRPTIMDILNIQRKGVFDESLTKKLLDSYIEKYGRENVAAACQRVFEEILIKYIRYLVGKYKIDRVCAAGGIFLNVKANMRLLKEGVVKDLFVYPNPTDGGTALGAAIIGLTKNGVKVKREEIIHSAYGREYSSSEILKELRKTTGIVYKKIGKELAKKTAKLLVEGKVVGWFQGRGEWGPRALGQRSVIADPRKVATKDRINDILKGREWFMPFAPSILSEKAPVYLKMLTKAPFMIIADDIRRDSKKDLLATIHVDDTVRPHLVTKEANRLYWEVIKEFGKLTGVSVILNTSFNKHGLPIVYSPKDAIEHLKWGTIDVLVIGQYLAERK